MYSLALCFSFCGDKGHPVLLENPAPEAERQTQLCLYDFGFLCFRDYLEGPERWVREDLQVLLLLWHHWRQHQPRAGHKLQVKLNNSTHPIFQHLLSPCLWWNIFQDGNPKGRTPGPCTTLHLSVWSHQGGVSFTPQGLPSPPVLQQNSAQAAGITQHKAGINLNRRNIFYL